MMKQQVLQQLSEHSGPFVSVALETSRSTAQTERATELRWRALSEQIDAPWLPSAVLDRIAEAVLRPVPQSGPSGRFVVASAAGLALDLILPEAPPRDELVVGPAPHLLPLIRATRCRASYLLVLIDRAGADLDLVVGVGVEPHHRTVTGTNDEIHKARAGLLSQRRVQSRAEDSWDRNAAEVATELASMVREHRPALVLAAGDPHALSALHGAIGEEVRVLFHRLAVGSRADGPSSPSLQAAVAAEQEKYEQVRRERVLDRFNSAQARQTAAVQGTEDVVAALARSQVDMLLLHDDPQSARTVWVGSAPDQIAVVAQDLAAGGTTSPTTTRADTAMVWAAVAGGGEVTLLDSADRALTNGVGAVLRWSDAATPHDRIPSMPGHEG